MQTYNFDGGLHLANQNQAICVRQERGNCRICWSAAAPSDVRLSGPTNVLMGYKRQENCCRYGVDGINTEGYDCFIINGAEDTAGGNTPSRLCGRSEGLVNALSNAATICCKLVCAH